MAVEEKKMNDFVMEVDESEEKEKNCLWPILPTELILHIFKYLPHSDLQQIRLVCTHWHDISRSAELMRKSKLVISRVNVDTLYDCLANDEELCVKLTYDTVELHNLEVSDELQYILQSLGPSIHKLRLYKSPVLPILNDCLPELKELTVARIPHVAPTHSGNILTFNLSKFKKLKSLDIGCYNVTTSIKTHMLLNLSRDLCLKMEKLCLELNKEHEELLIYTLTLHSKSLRHLEIYLRALPPMNTKWKQVFALFSRLETLKISGVFCYRWVRDLVECLPKATALRHCDLSGGVRVGDDVLNIITHKWAKSLENIELMFCSDLTDEGVKHLGVLRHNLSSLNISHCTAVTAKGLLQGLVANENTTLKTFILNDIPVMDAEYLGLLSQRLPHLTSLRLENCHFSITDSTLECIFRHQVKLQHLMLADCLRISDKGILGFGQNPAPLSNLKGLQTLGLKVCRNLSNCALIEGIKFRELRKLDIGYCHKVTSTGIKGLVKNCPALEDLTIASCMMIDDDAILHIGQGLPRLRRLNVSNCVKLTSKSIYYVVELCKSLKEISMYGMDLLDYHEVQEKLLTLKSPFKELYL